MDRLSWMIFPKSPTRWWFQIFFMFIHPYLGKIPIFTMIFHMGWFNHQPAQDEEYHLYVVWFRVNSPKVDNLQALLSKKSFDFTWGFPWIKAYQLPGKVITNIYLSIGWQHGALKAESFKCHLLSSQPVYLRRLVPLGFTQCTS